MAQFASAQPDILRAFLGQAWSILRLAIPVTCTRAGLVIMMTVDTAIVGRAGTVELANFGISLPPQTVAFVIMVVLLSSAGVLISQAKGAGELRQCGRIWRIGLAVGFLAASLVGAMLLPSERLLLALGQTPELATAGGVAVRIWAASLPGMALYAGTTIFLEAIGRPIVGLVIVILGNLVNAALCWILVYGHAGAPELGAMGAALATAATRWLMAATAIGYAITMADARQLGVFDRIGRPWPVVAKILRLGLPLSIAGGVETLSFFALATYAGWLGPAILAAYQISLNIMTTVYMVSIGVSVATSVHVGLAVGWGDRRGIAIAGWSGTAVIVALTGLAGLVFGLLAGPIVTTYTDDAVVVAMVLAAVGIICCNFVVDGLQAVLLNAARGVADVIVPTIMFVLSFPFVMAPLGYWLGPQGGMHALVGGDPTAAAVAGLLWSAFAGLSLASLLVALRFAVLTGRPPKRI